MTTRRTTLALLAEDGAPLPTEFRLFVHGVNPTENGPFLFDDEAAQSVMTAWASWGIDRMMIDLEHQSLDPPSPDPTARDARGWCQLELRGGELWAVNVTWTPDGAARLQNKTQRYVSPAFESDPETNRILKMINVAIVAMPATHATPALVAASRPKAGVTRMAMSRECVMKALDAMEKGDHEAASKLLKEMVADAAAGDEPGSADRGGEGQAPPSPEKESSDVVDPKVVDNSLEDDDEKEEDDPKKKTERKAMRRMLRRLVGKASMFEVVEAVSRLAALAATIQVEQQRLARDRAALEGVERRRLVADLVKCGAEFPSTVFADPLKKDGALKPRWEKMPIVELRALVADQKAVRGDKVTAVEPPPGDPRVDAADGQDVKLPNGKTVRLSAAHVKYAHEAGAKLEDYAQALAWNGDVK